MNRRDFLRTTGCACLGVNRIGQTLSKRKPRPNILFIVADDLGFSDLGCYGGEIETPSLDSLAKDGIRFTQCYSTGRCWPSRGSILTGYYAQQIRRDTSPGIPVGKRPGWARLLPEILKPQGYRSYHSGKWHVDGTPLEAGFDASYWLEDTDRNFGPQKHFENDQPLSPPGPEEKYYTSTAFADHAIRCLTDHAAHHADKPFFEYLAFTSPHFPLHALPRDIEKYRDRYQEGWDSVREARLQRLHEMGIVSCGLSSLEPTIRPQWNLSEEDLRTRIGEGEMAWARPWKDLSEAQREFQATKMALHAAMIDRMDQEIGRVLEQLRTMNALDNTFICFVSDNGASAEQMIRGDGHDPSAPPGSARSFLCLGPGWSSAANTPFRLHKYWVHEGGISSPMIVHWPAGLKEKGALRRTLSHLIDLTPTAMDLAQAECPTEWQGSPVPQRPGLSLVPALKEDIQVNRDCLYFSHQGNRAIRAGDWKLVSGAGKEPWALHDLSVDRCENVDLSDQHPDKVKELADLWQSRTDEFTRTASGSS